VFTCERFVSDREELIHIFSLAELVPFEYAGATVVVGEGQGVLWITDLLDTVFIVPGDLPFSAVVVVFPAELVAVFVVAEGSVADVGGCMGLRARSCYLLFIFET